MNPARLFPAMVILASAAVLASALAFQYIGELRPCVLCIYQRYPYVAAIALGVAALALRGRRPRAVPLALTTLVFLVGAGIAAFHVGVEQHWWQGTTACGGTIGGDGSLADLKARLLAAPVVRCDEVPWSFLGVSMAGYNVLLSLGLAAFAAYGTARLAARRRRR